MRLETKKIIARESLILLGVCLVAVIWEVTLQLLGTESVIPFLVILYAIIRFVVWVIMTIRK